MLRYIRFSIILGMFMLLCPFQAWAASQFVVVIDAGHGGGDVGTPHRKCKQDEKTIALNVALKLGKMIEEKYPEVKIVYTRTTDVYPTLPDRTRIAREAKGNLFISIHVNAAGDSRAKGVETYVFGITGLKGKSEAEQQRIRERTMIERENLDIDGKQIDFETAVDIETKILCQTQREKHNKYSLEVAHYVQDNIMSALRRSDYRSSAFDRGVKQKNIFVLCYSPMPAILIELGYMSNSAEERFMNTENAKAIYAGAIFKGVEQYMNNWRRRQLKEGEAPETNSSHLVLLPMQEGGVPVVPGSELTVPAAQADQQLEAQPASQPAAQPQPEENYLNIVAPDEVEKKADTVTTAPQTVASIIEQKAQAAQTVQTQETKPVVPEKKAEVPVGAFVPEQEAKECYRIQFMSSTAHFKRGDSVLKGLWPVSCYKVDGYYRYTYGEGKTRADLQTEIQKIRKLFPDAFVVHFNAEGKRIP